MSGYGLVSVRIPRSLLEALKASGTAARHIDP